VKLDNSLIEAALVGYQEELKRVDEKMKALRQRINEGNGTSAKATTAKAEPAPQEKRKSRLSPAARRRIAAAQRKRWAAYKAALAGKG
jgi:cell division septum initiation protein DivIVA